MLKAFAVRSLLPEMLLGRTVYDGDTDIVLVEGGTVLDRDMIKLLKEKGVASVYVDEDSILAAVQKEKAIKREREAASEDTALPERDAKLDSKYEEDYRYVYGEMEKLFQEAALTGRLNMDILQPVMASGRLRDLYKEGATAVSMIYTMNQDGDYNIHHCVHLAILSGLMAKWMGLVGMDRQNLVLAGLFLDIGKQFIEKDLLEKKGRLTEEEFDILKNHVVDSFKLLEGSELSGRTDLMNGVIQHHERNDGSGYPSGLEADQISTFGKVLAVLDSYDAMASSRSYAEKRSPFEVFKILYADVLDGKLDSEYAVLFMRKLNAALNGCWLRLSDGTAGRIVYIDESRVTAMPVVQLTDGGFIDLNTVKDITVVEIMTAADVSKL
ncbi:HD domain protein [Selenomonas sp. oral taxon 892 str. F0426]|uniref:HD-GYP domain-containing protein n=1 Tax=Selenomonas sp. oral taxon 892 TaxID=1321785 RepID=UPI0003ACE325|nr:HD domain-containing phosphohydrolase [Selenomonas sp. oral taxon 892]ERJ95426.1 HD domain protein [Selenomonas sp. oral taxon 892 str. F0426]